MAPILANCTFLRQNASLDLSAKINCQIYGPSSLYSNYCQIINLHKASLLYPIEVSDKVWAPTDSDIMMYMIMMMTMMFKILYLRHVIFIIICNPHQSPSTNPNIWRQTYIDLSLRLHNVMSHKYSIRAVAGAGVILAKGIISFTGHSGGSFSNSTTIGSFSHFFAQWQLLMMIYPNGVVERFIIIVVFIIIHIVIILIILILLILMMINGKSWVEQVKRGSKGEVPSLTLPASTCEQHPPHHPPHLRRPRLHHPHPHRPLSWPDHPKNTCSHRHCTYFSIYISLQKRRPCCFREEIRSF